MTIIKHNLRTLPKRDGSRTGWYLTMGGHFMHVDNDITGKGTARNEWSPEDRRSFHEWLMGWDSVSVPRRGG